MRRLVSVVLTGLGLALIAQPAGATNASIFKTMQTYVRLSAPHQNAFDDHYSAREFAGARTEVAAIARNAVAARAVLARQKASNARGAKGKTLMLEYWRLKRAATAELELAVDASALSDATTAKRHITRYDKLADEAVGLLFVGLPLLKPPTR